MFIFRAPYYQKPIAQWPTVLAWFSRTGAYNGNIQSKRLQKLQRWSVCDNYWSLFAFVNDYIFYIDNTTYWVWTSRYGSCKKYCANNICDTKSFWDTRFATIFTFVVLQKLKDNEEKISIKKIRIFNFGCLIFSLTVSSFSKYCRLCKDFIVNLGYI